MGLIRKLNIGQGFSLNYQNRKVEVVLIEDYPKEAIFDITGQDEESIPQVAIPYGTFYRIEGLPETTFVPFRRHG